MRWPECSGGGARLMLFIGEDGVGCVGLISDKHTSGKVNFSLGKRGT